MLEKELEMRATEYANRKADEEGLLPNGADEHVGLDGLLRFQYDNNKTQL